MGRPKLTLPLGSRTVLEAVIATLQQAEVHDVYLVTAPDADELRALGTKAGAIVLSLPHDTPDMRATVLFGLDQVEKLRRPDADDSWLLVPADHPTLAAEVVAQLHSARIQHPTKSIFHPTFAGKRGHPTLLAWKHVAGIRQLGAGQGLNVYFRQRAADTCEVPVADADILLDLDTPEDYERLVGTFRTT